MDDELDQLVSKTLKSTFGVLFKKEESPCFACLFSQDFYKHFHFYNRRIRWWPVSSLVVISEVAVFLRFAHFLFSELDTNVSIAPNQSV